MVRLELPPNENRKRVEKVPAIPATLTFLDENGMPEDGREPVRFQAKFAADADNVLEMSIIHTGDLKTGEDELADLLFDAYRNGSIDEAEIQGWDSLQYQLKQLRNSMGHVAAAVLKGPEQAMEDLMKQHLVSFQDERISWPDQRLEAMVSLERGTLRMSFEPDRTGPQETGANKNERSASMSYEWGIESSSEQEAGCLQEGSGCGHRHEKIYQAVDCLLANTGRTAPTGRGTEGAIVARADGTALDKAERDILEWGLDRWRPEQPRGERPSG